VGEWPTAKFDFTADSQRLLDEAESKRVRELKEEEKDTYVPLDKSIESEKQYKVFFEGEGDARRPWDVYMTKVDLKNGAFGDYVFYKMQMVYDSNRDLYIVITRYGRIGELGMHQRTPFGSLDEAKKEFCDIFKQKSSNEWETAATNFVPQPKKYQLVNITYKNIKYEDYLAPFDWNHCPESQLVKAVHLMLEEICNLTMFQRSLSSIRVDTSQLPLSRIDKATVRRAQEIL
jgi:poly [ADP-ribose] polymerase/centrosomal protein CEP128